MSPSPGFRFVCRHSVRRRAVRSHDAAPRAPAAMAGRRRDAHALRLPRGRRSGVDAARAREGEGEGGGDELMARLGVVYIIVCYQLYSTRRRGARRRASGWSIATKNASL